jgi:hypothetical protein
VLGVRSGYLAKAEVVINTKVLDKVETQCQPPTWSRGFDGTERVSRPVSGSQALASDHITPSGVV